MKKKILLVEDDLRLLNLYQLELKESYDIVVAHNGKEALEMANVQLPDLVLMDIMMPVMDGLQAASQIRRNPKTQAIPILAATAKALTGDKENCLASGCSDYLAKPFTHRELDTAIRKLLEPDSEPT